MQPDFSEEQVSWRISTESANAGGQCVEAGLVNDGTGRVALRHSRNPNGTMIVFTREEWIEFVGLVGSVGLSFD